MKSSDLSETSAFLGRKKQGKQKTKWTINNSRVHCKKWEKELKEKERNRYYLFPFVVWIWFRCLSAAATIAAAAATIIYYYLLK